MSDDLCGTCYLCTYFDYLNKILTKLSKRTATKYWYFCTYLKKKRNLNNSLEQTGFVLLFVECFFVGACLG